MAHLNWDRENKSNFLSGLRLLNLKSRFFEFIRKLRDPKDYSLRNRLYVFLVCLGISVFIWFLIVLSKESYTSIDYPIVYENVPKDLVLLSKTDSILSFRVASGGFELFTFKYLTRKEKITIDLSDLPLSREGNYYMSVFPTRQISNKIVNKMNISEEIVSISPENIYFKFEILSGKKVKIIPDLDVTFAQQYQFSDSVQIIPDRVTINGPKNVIDKIRYIETESINLQNVSESQTVISQLKLPESANNLKLVPTEVEVSFTVDKYTESTIEVPIKYFHENTRIKTYPENVILTYLVSLKNFNRVDIDMFKATVNYSDDINSRKLKVEISHSPPFVKITKIEPEEVEFLIIK